MKLSKCVAFLNVLNLVTNGKNKNVLKDENEVFRKINNKLSVNRAENYEDFWDSSNNSFAKINLTLNVDPSSNVLDKYLNLCTLMQKITWGNKIFIKKIDSEESENISDYYEKTENGDYLLLVDDTPQVSDSKGDSCSQFPFDNKNIISKVLNKLRPHGHKYIVLTKKSIPLGSGLGGGSSDAASIINTLSEGKQYNLAKIGSDVPFLASDTAGVFGIGDKMYEIYKNIYPGWVYLLIPFETVSTVSAFQKARELITSGKIPKCDMKKVLMDNLKSVENFKTFVPNNDLLKCITNLNLKKLNKVLKQRFKKNKFGMSGSGSSFFVFSDNDSEVIDIRNYFKNPLIIVKTKFKYNTKSHEYFYL